MKAIVIYSTWQAFVVVEVGDDGESNNVNFTDWPQEVREQVSSLTGELMDGDLKEPRQIP